MRFDARTRHMFAAPMDPSRCLTSKRRLTDWSGKPPLTRRNECSHVTPAAPNGDQWSGLASVVTIAFTDGLSLAARCSRRISIRLGWFGSAPGGLANVNPLLKFPAGRRASASVAARQVRRRHLILVIRLCIESFSAGNMSLARAASIWRPLERSQDAIATDGACAVDDMFTSESGGGARRGPGRAPRSRPIHRRVPTDPAAR